MAVTTGYDYSKSITLDHTKVSGGSDLSSFPVLIKVTDADLATTANGGKVTSSSGFDIIFTDSTQTTLLNHEIESYVATTGEIEMWVNVPTVSATVDTVIYVFFGNSGVTTTQEHATAVWDTNFVGVWHLDQNPAGTAPQVLDSTSNAFNLTANGSMTSANQVAGQIDGSLKFTSSSSQFLSGSTSATLTPTALTISAWVKPTALPASNATMGLVNKRDNSSGTAGYLFQLFNSAGTQQVSYNVAGSSLAANSTLSITAWTHLAVTQTSTSANIYVNGASVKTGAVTALSNFNTAFQLASRAGSFFNGTMDETRLSKVVRTAGWITTEYNNQFSPSTFFAVGSLTATATTGTLSATQAAQTLTAAGSALVGGTLSATQAAQTLAGAASSSTATGTLAATQAAQITPHVPSTPVVIDTSNSIATSIAGAWLLGINSNDYVSGYQGTVYTGAPGTGTDTYGPCYAGASSTSIDSIQIGAGHILGGQANFTILAGGTWPAHGPGAQNALYCERSSAGQDIVKFQAGTDATNPDSLGIVYRDDANNLLDGINGGKTVRDSAFHHVAYVKSGTSFSQYVDSSLDKSATLSTTNGFTEASTVALVGGDPADSSTQINAGKLTYLYTFSRALSQSEIASIYQNPFQIFKVASAAALSSTQGAQTISAAGSVAVRGTLSVTQGAQTVTAAGSESVTATLAATQSAQTVAASGGPVVKGTLAATQSAQTVAAAAGPVAGGALAATQGAQTFAGTATETVAGALAATQGAETLAGAASLGPVTGALAATQSAQTVAAAAGPVARGTLASTQGAQTVIATSGAIVGSALVEQQSQEILSSAGSVIVAGALVAQEGQEVLSAIATTTVAGALSIAQGAQTLAGSVAGIVGGTLALSQNTETLSAAASLGPVTGTLVATQGGQALAAAGRAIVAGALAATQAAHAMVGAGGPAVAGTLAASQGGQSLTGAATRGSVNGTLSTTQAAETLAAAAALGPVTGALAATQGAQTAAAVAVEQVGGTVALTQGAQTFAGAAGPVVAGLLSENQSAQAISGAASIAAEIAALTATQASQLFTTGGFSSAFSSAFAQNGGTASVIVGAALSTTQAGQALATAGSVIAGAALAETQAAQTLTGTGKSVVAGALATAQAPQTLVSASGGAGAAALSVTQASNSLAGTAGLAVAGQLAATQAPQTEASHGAVVVGGALARTSASNLLAAVARANVAGQAIIVQGAQVLAARAAPSTLASLALNQAPQTLSGHLTTILGTYPPWPPARIASVTPSGASILRLTGAEGSLRVVGAASTSSVASANPTNRIA